MQYLVEFKINPNFETIRASNIEQAKSKALEFSSNQPKEEIISIKPLIIDETESVLSSRIDTWVPTYFRAVVPDFWGDYWNLCNHTWANINKTPLNEWQENLVGFILGCYEFLGFSKTAFTKDNVHPNFACFLKNNKKENEKNEILSM